MGFGQELISQELINITQAQCCNGLLPNGLLPMLTKLLLVLVVENNQQGPNKTHRAKQHRTTIFTKMHVTNMLCACGQPSFTEPCTVNVSNMKRGT